MKTPLLLGSALGILLLAGTASAATVNYKATLTVAEEMSDGTTTVTGTNAAALAAGVADLTFDDTTKILTGTVTYTNMTGPVTAGHIHDAPCNNDGSPIEPLFSTETAPATIEVNIDWSGADDADKVTKLSTGGLYVNLHTAMNPNGEVRGQIWAESSTQTCPATPPPDGGTDTDAGTSSGGTSGAGTSGATTTPDTDAGTTTTTPTTSSDSGCSTTGSSNPTGPLALALGVGLAIAAVSRSRKNKKS